MRGSPAFHYFEPRHQRLMSSLPLHSPPNKCSAQQDQARDYARQNPVNNQRATSSPQIESSSDKTNHRANESNEEVKTKHRDDEHETTVEDVRRRFVLCQHQRISRFVTRAGEPLMNGPLNAVKPLTNLNVVIKIGRASCRERV